MGLTCGAQGCSKAKALHGRFVKASPGSDTLVFSSCSIVHNSVTWTLNHRETGECSEVCWERSERGDSGQSESLSHLVTPLYYKNQDSNPSPGYEL